MDVESSPTMAAIANSVGRYSRTPNFRTAARMRTVRRARECERLKMRALPVRCRTAQCRGAILRSPEIVKIADSERRLALQLAFEGVEDLPVGALIENLLRRGPHHSDLAKTQRVKPHRVRGVVLPPLRIRQVVKPRSTSERAARSGSRAHTVDAFKMARTARFVAVGCARTKSRLPESMQQKYCDHGRSSVLLMMTWPILRARSSCGRGGKPIYASTLPSGKKSVRPRRRCSRPT